MTIHLSHGLSIPTELGPQGDDRNEAAATPAAVCLGGKAETGTTSGFKRSAEKRWCHGSFCLVECHEIRYFCCMQQKAIILWLYMDRYIYIDTYIYILYTYIYICYIYIYICYIYICYIYIYMLYIYICMDETSTRTGELLSTFLGGSGSARPAGTPWISGKNVSPKGQL